MALEAAQAALTILGLHTNAPAVFWRGQRLTHVVRVRGHADATDGEVTVKVYDPADEHEALYVEMEAAGINIKRGGN